MRIVFMGTPEFAVPSLEILVKKGYEIAIVVTQPDKPYGRGRELRPSPVKETALQYGIPVIQPESMKDTQFIGTLKDIQPDLIVIVAYGHILPPNLLELPGEGSINLHASLLPQYRGAAPINWAIIRGETVTGLTTFFLAEEMDAGDIILQRSVPIGESETAGELSQRLAELGAPIVEETVKLIAEGNAPRTAQDHSKATYAPKLRKEDAKINWENSAVNIFNLIRGTTPSPGAYTEYHQQILKVIKSTPIETEIQSTHPGEVVNVDKTLGITVSTSQGYILLQEVQPADKRIMTASDFARGYRIKVGDRLG